MVAPAAEFPLAKPINGRFAFGLITYRPGDKQLAIALPGGSAAKIPIPFLIDGDALEHARVLVADFDFDGAPDLMVPVSTGYGGVNWFYTLHRFDPALRRFRPPEKDEFCNPEPRPGEKLLAVPCKSGPAWYDDAYKFDAAGRPYRYRTNDLIALTGFEGDESVAYLQRLLDPAGRGLKSSVLDAGESKPAIRRIPGARVYLHDAPEEKSRSAAYVVKGDSVELLDVADRDGRQWLQIAYRSARAGRLVKWIKLESDK